MHAGTLQPSGEAQRGGKEGVEELPGESPSPTNPESDHWCAAVTLTTTGKIIPGSPWGLELQ